MKKENLKAVRRAPGSSVFKSGEAYFVTKVSLDSNGAVFWKVYSREGGGCNLYRDSEFRNKFFIGKEAEHD